MLTSRLASEELGGIMRLWRAIFAGSFLTMAATAIAQDWIRQPYPGFEPLPAPFVPAVTPLEPEMPAAPTEPIASVAPAAPLRPVNAAIAADAPSALPVQSTCYTRIDYFHWNERVAHQDFVNENGPLVTLGYLRRVGNERFRGEFFESSVSYKSSFERHDGTIEEVRSHTNYFGVRGEYDVLFDPGWLPPATLFAGIGSRFWFRHFPDADTLSGRTRVFGYLETWWTTYPYVGIQRRRAIGSSDVELFASGRVGATAANFQHVSLIDVVLFPKLGITSQLEIGVIGPRFFLTGYSELFTWGQSSGVRQSYQPASSLVTVGLRTGIVF